MHKDPESKVMQIGVDSFGAVISDPATEVSVSAVQRTDNLIEEIVLADQVGLDVFGVGEHHRSEFVDSAPVVILSAAAARTKNIRLTRAVTVLSAGTFRNPPVPRIRSPHSGSAATSATMSARSSSLNSLLAMAR